MNAPVVPAIPTQNIRLQPQELGCIDFLQHHATEQQCRSASSTTLAAAPRQLADKASQSPENALLHRHPVMDPRLPHLRPRESGHAAFPACRDVLCGPQSRWPPCLVPQVGGAMDVDSSGRLRLPQQGVKEL
jgi:hypothetical protein